MTLTHLSPSYSVFLLIQLFVPRYVLMDAALTASVNVMQVTREHPVTHVSHNGQCKCDPDCEGTVCKNPSNPTNTQNITPLWSTHWCRDKMAVIFQTTFSNTISWMKMYGRRLRFHWSLFWRVQLTILWHWFRWWPGAGQAPSHHLNQ